MEKLKLLFTKDGLQYEITKIKTLLEENSYLPQMDSPQFSIAEKLDEILAKKKYSEIAVVSALNHFSLTPDSFKNHEVGMELISYNANVDKDVEELMLSVNKKYAVQFYYAFPKIFYHKLKNQDTPVHFNFSGEKFLNSITNKHKKEIHINLYHQQCEFFAFSEKQVVLYNNLDVSSEVDFLYFIMFTLSKIGFGTQDTYFYVYGETTENETFISELRKFVKHLKINFDNLPGKNFILR